MRRISIKDNEFIAHGGGSDRPVVSYGENYIDVIIVNAAPVARTYYAGEYDARKTTPPTCWSEDTAIPSVDVAEDNKQSSRCMDCPQNIKGSGNNGGRACRYSQRLAVVFVDDLEDIHQLQLPATSIFGGDDSKMSMQKYAKLLVQHQTAVVTVVTQVYFDDDSKIPKLLFKPFRSLKEDELEIVTALQNHPDALMAISMGASAREVTPSALFDDDEDDGFDSSTSVFDDDEEDGFDSTNPIS